MQVKPASECQYDIVSLGEVMIRLDPGESRIRTARSFKVWEGGGEYNVARGLRRCFNQRAALVSAFADNEVGRLAEDLILQGGVDASFVKWVPYDGLGRTVRNGLNFTERGFGIRGAIGCSDRGQTAASQLKPGDIDWNHLFGTLGVRWFHTGGIYAGLSESTSDVILEAVSCAKEHGTVVSYDLNYRPSLWQGFGGLEKAQSVNRGIAKYVDVMLGNEEDFTACLGIEVEGANENLTNIDVGHYERMIEETIKEFPNLLATGTTLREVHTASRNDWSALCWFDGRFHVSREYSNLDILDRVGGGDSFASGLIYGFLTSSDGQKAVDYGAAHGALAMTTPGDTTMATVQEVEKVMSGGNARVVR